MAGAARAADRDDFWVGDVALVDVLAAMSLLVPPLAALVAIRLGSPSTVVAVILYGGLALIGACRFAFAWILVERDVRANAGLPHAPGPIAGPLVAALFTTTAYLFWRTIAIGGGRRWLLVAIVSPFVVLGAMPVIALLIVESRGTASPLP